MKFNINQWMRVTLVIAVSVVSLSCSNEFTSNAAPVELVATNNQDLQLIDLAGNPPGSDACDRDVGEILLRAILRNPNPNVDQRFNDVRVSRYRVSYVRNDGGSLVPAPFVRSIDLLVPATGEDAGLGSFVILQSDAILQQPFAALFPQNGGRDPETGRTVVRMDVIMDFFGETLAGANVSGRTRFTIDFCFDCGGCRPEAG